MHSVNASPSQHSVPSGGWIELSVVRSAGTFFDAQKHMDVLKYSTIFANAMMESVDLILCYFFSPFVNLLPIESCRKVYVCCSLV